MKEKILVSACLAGYPCRYDGKSNEVLWCKKLVEEGIGIPICPEQFGGLSTPRIRSERKGDKVIQESGNDVTKEFHLGAKKALTIAKEKDVHYAILKAKSPSCGNKQIYDGTFTHNLVEGKGVTAELFEKEGIQVFDENEEDLVLSLLKKETGS